MTNQNLPLPELNQATLDRAIDSHEMRRKIAKDFRGFCLIYLTHYFYLDPATFHPQLVRELVDEKNKRLEVIGFRGSAKSTFGSLALPIWAALEQPERYPFIIPIADTGLQASINIANIKNELDQNKLIKQDYGEIKGKFVEDWTLESEEEWQSKNMLLSNGVRILARSRGQKIRGLRHRQHRPKLVVIDDPEDLEWVRKKENRDKTERWLRGEVMPGVDTLEGRLILITNQLHTDAIAARMRRTGKFKVLEYPLLDPKGACVWPALYRTQKDLDDKRDEVGLPSWQREYLLRVVAEEGQEVSETEIKYYDAEPKAGTVGVTGTGVDLAISEKETADYTTMVSGKVAWEENRPKIYIEPYPVNARLDLASTMEQQKAIKQVMGGYHTFFVEDVGYQKAAIKEMERNLLPVKPMPAIREKRARLKVAAVYIKNGTVLFPRKGCEDLLLQLTGFGVEEHDDLVDALVYLILGLVDQGMQPQEVIEII